MEANFGEILEDYLNIKLPRVGGMDVLFYYVECV